MDSNLSYRGTKAQDFEASRAHSLSHLRQAKRHLPRCYGYRGSTPKATEAARCVRAWARAIMHDLGHYSAERPLAARCRAKIPCGHGPVMLQPCSGARRNRS